MGHCARYEINFAEHPRVCEISYAVECLVVITAACHGQPFRPGFVHLKPSGVRPVRLKQGGYDSPSGIRKSKENLSLAETVK